ncbi:MAG: hypothetical protein GY725_16470 [bacterium]|nr:hypothetical protein [bacterium]
MVSLLHFVRCLLVGSMLALPGAAHADDALALIIHSEGAVISEISLPALRRVYLGKTTRHAGSRIEPLHLRSGSSARQVFTRAVFGKSEQEMQDYWIQQALSGGDLPPREFGSPESVIEAVSQKPGVLGYVPLKALNPQALERVRVLRVGKGEAAPLPGENRYPIRIVERDARPQP